MPNPTPDTQAWQSQLHDAAQHMILVLDSKPGARYFLQQVEAIRDAAMDCVIDQEQKR